MNPVLLGILRHILTAIGGAFVTQGYIGESDVQLIAGAVTTLIGVAWSIYSKRNG